MTLGFKQEIGGKPTYFAEKIIESLPLADYKIMTLMDSLAEEVNPTEEQFDAGICNPLFNHVPKLHTIRQDKNNLWAVGKLIHPVINNRSPNRFQFAPVMKCVSVQKIDIRYIEVAILHRTKTITGVKVFVDGIELNTNDKIIAIAVNDGFDSPSDFFAYFSKDFTGKIIHWTDLRY